MVAGIGSGNGWVECVRGHRHWGLFGAAGVLIRSGDRVLLQHRVAWSHHGDTWGVPGGARDEHETPEGAALREAHEEVGVTATQLRVGASHVDDHGGWSYTTVVAHALVSVEEMSARAVAETLGVAWVADEQVTAYRLHPGFAATWPVIRTLS